MWLFHGQEAKSPLDLNIHGLNLALAIRAWSWCLLPTQFLLFLIKHIHEPHFSPARFWSKASLSLALDVGLCFSTFWAWTWRIVWPDGGGRRGVDCERAKHWGRGKGPSSPIYTTLGTWGCWVDRISLIWPISMLFFLVFSFFTSLFSFVFFNVIFVDFTVLPMKEPQPKLVCLFSVVNICSDKCQRQFVENVLHY